MIPETDRPWLSITQAAQYVGVSRRTIYNWLRAGKLDSARTAGGSQRIARASLITVRQERGDAP